MRIGELINLRWSDVDFNRKVITIRVQENWKPKGRRDRTVPMHPKVETVLRQAQRVGQSTCSPARVAKHIKESVRLGVSQA